MAFSPTEIDVRIAFDTWTIPELISHSGYQAARTISGHRVIIANRSSTRIDWLNVDVGIAHDGVRSKKVENSMSDGTTTEHRKLKGVETLPVKIYKGIPAGGIERCELPESRHNPGRHPNSYIVLRVYGVADGREFLHHIANGYIPPLEVTNTYTISFCFIANAAFRDPEHPVVKELRFVRDELLKHSPTGRRFIAFYYRHSPRVAAAMASRPMLRAGARCVLTPIALTVRASRRTVGALSTAKRRFKALVS